MVSPSKYQFGEFRLDAKQRALFRRGQLVALTPKSVETLLFLVERHGRIVDKQELMQAVWPDTFVEEVSLARNVSVLRKVLSEGKDGHSYIETIPKRGYRFVAPVAAQHQEQSPGSSEWIPLLPLPKPYDRKRDSGTEAAGVPRRRWGLTVTVAAATLSVSAWILWPRDSAPHVTRSVQLTTFGRAADPLAVAGDRLFLGVRTGGARQITQISSIPGALSPEEPLVLPAPLPKPHIYDVSPDGTQLLVGSGPGADEQRELWIMPAAGGAPKRLGNLSATGAGWSPDAKRIVYTADRGVYVANKDGSDALKLADVAGTPFWPRWSPDGRVIRYSINDANQEAASLWEVSSRGGPARKLFPALQRPDDYWGAGSAFGSWTQDGRFFFFLVGHRSGYASTSSIWVIEDRRHPLRRYASPKQIFVAPLELGPPVPSADGKRLFFTSRQEDRQLLKYDPADGRFIPWLKGAAVASVDYSLDSQWVSYVTFPDGGLWRARADGSEALRLAESPALPFSPVFSPDGKRVAFYDARSIRTRRIFVLPRDGGAAVPVTSGDDSSPTWFPDGKSIVYRHLSVLGASGGDPPGIYRFDEQSGRTERIPGSEGKTDPAVSPDGQAIVAVSDDLHRLWVFNLAAAKWTQLASGAFLRSPCWSRDGAFIYYQDYYEGSEQPIYRLRLRDGRIEKVATAAAFQRSDVFHGYLFHGLAPDGQPLVSLLRNKSDIFALELEPPE